MGVERTGREVVLDVVLTGFDASNGLRSVVKLSRSSFLTSFLGSTRCLLDTGDCASPDARFLSIHDPTMVRPLPMSIPV